MSQQINYKQLSSRIGMVFADTLMIVGAIFLIVAVIEMGKVGTLETRYPDYYDYNLMTMKIYGIAMMVSGFVAYFVNLFMNFISSPSSADKHESSKE